MVDESSNRQGEFGVAWTIHSDDPDELLSMLLSDT
jgi:hypothetical protein